MFRLARSINRSNERNAARAEKVGGRREGEGRVPMDAIPFMGRNGGGVGVELRLGETNRSVGRRGGDCGNGSKNGNGEEGARP